MKNLLPFVERDRWLWPVADKIEKRYNDYRATRAWIESEYGSLYAFAGAHLYFGLHYDKRRKVWTFREWLPHARRVFFIGDFNDWDQTAHALHRLDNGVWEIELEARKVPGLKHLSHYKIYVQDCDGKWAMRMPAYAFYTHQDENSKDFTAVVWEPKIGTPSAKGTGGDARTPENWREGVSPLSNSSFKWTDAKFRNADYSKHTPLIYEAHIGMAQEKEGVGTYREFADSILPRIKDGGYNIVQLMAVAEHPYYGSFGYHVSNFFAPSSRFGTPDDLRYLVNKAHSMGLSVVMDVVHAHFVENINEGLNKLDGSDDLYSYGGEAGTHPYWGSRMFNFARNEVRSFLLSNLRYWMEEFHFDGFRFDGVTAMIYFHRGYTDNFGTYQNYFGGCVDNNALIYLGLANDLVAEMRPNVGLSIAEEVSGMPGITVPTSEGGIGFNYRLSMGIPDYWIKIIKEREDGDWIMGDLWSTVNNRLAGVPQIAYSESHDQALVGDQTLAFRLMGAEMYTNMSVFRSSPVIDRGIALHKMIRLFSLFVGAEGGGYLTFMGNEFGHPEWIDFPREGNGWSYQYARRQWSLADNDTLRYKYLNAFDREMLKLAREMNLRECFFAWLLNTDEENKTICFDVKDGEYVFVFNFHTERCIPDYAVPVRKEGKYQLVLCSDDTTFGGFDRVHADGPNFTQNGRLLIYNVNRAAQVYSFIKE